MLLAEALESGVVLDEEQIEFLADNRDRVTTSQASQEVTTTSIFQTDNLDVFDSDCDGAPSASAIFMAKLSAYDLEVFLKYSEQLPFNNETDFDITSGNTVISYEQYLKETENAVVQDTNSSTQQDAMIMSVIEEMFSQVAKCNEGNKENKILNDSLTAKLEIYKEQIKFFEERHKFDLNDKEKYIDGKLLEVIVDINAKCAYFQNQIHMLKLQLSTTIESHKTLSTTVDALKKESKANKDKYLDEI
ncbi:hypothetical protein Tco_0977753, partial [Tanacetum coccineum]